MIFEKLVNEEIDAMKSFIESYAFYECNSAMAPMSKILQYWDDAKGQWLYKMFGEKLILSKDLSYSMGVDELSDQIEEQMFRGWSDTDCQEFIRAYRELTNWGGIYQNNYLMDNLLDTYVLAENIYKGESFTIDLPDESILQVNKGCKVSKILGKIAKALNLPGYEAFRIAHSQVLNQKQLKGKLCISIHPLDYMTMSANDCDWTSCMDWTDEGEYRRGTVEMMNSPMVVVAYLTASTPYKVGKINWSNKKWRQLFIVNPDIITGVKAYPYYNEHLEKAVNEWLRDLAAENLGWKYMDNYIKYDHSCSCKIDGLEDNIRITFHTNAMYNDFGTVAHYGFINKDIPHNYHCTYSGVGNCMCCGEAADVDFDNDEYSLTCLGCEHAIKCADCGERYHIDDMIWLEDDYYCNYCYESIATHCDVCEDVYHNSSCYNIYLARENANGEIEIMRDIAITACSDCKRRINNGRISTHFIGKEIIHSQEEYWENVYYILATNCTEEGLSLFSFDSMEELKDYESCHVIKANLN